MRPPLLPKRHQARLHQKAPPGIIDMFVVFPDILCRGYSGPPTVGTVLKMLNGGVVIVFPTVEVFVAEVAGDVVWVEFGGVEIETSFG